MSTNEDELMKMFGYHLGWKQPPQPAVKEPVMTAPTINTPTAISGYQTTDGVIHPDMLAAAGHQANLDFTAWFNELGHGMPPAVAASVVNELLQNWKVVPKSAPAVAQ